MTLFGREPRSVYRIYAEDEYFESDRSPTEIGRQPPALGSGSSGQAGSVGRRPNATALLVAGAIATVALLVLAIVLLAGGESPRRPAGAATAPVRKGSGTVVRLAPQPRRRGRRRRGPAGPRRAGRTAADRLAALARSSSSRLAVAAASGAAVSLRSDPELEFGFER